MPANPPGMASPMVRKPAIATSSSSRSAVCTGGWALVSQAYPSYIHHSSPKISSTRPASAAVNPLASSVASWVRVNAKTRSKNSSSVVTRSGGSSAPGAAPSPARPAARAGSSSARSAG